MSKNMVTLKQYIQESIEDKGIFKSIFVIGLPGAGKSYTITEISGAIAPKIISADRPAEFLSKKWKKQIDNETWSEFEGPAKRMSINSLKSYVNSMLPLFIDGTTNNISNILKRMGILESLGYDVGVIFVHCPIEIAIERAKERAKKINRHVDDDFIRHVDSQNIENAMYLKSKVKFFKQIENGANGLDDKEIKKAFVECHSFFTENVHNPVGQRYIKELKADPKKRYLTDIISKEKIDEMIRGWHKS